MASLANCYSDAFELVDFEEPSEAQAAVSKVAPAPPEALHRLDAARETAAHLEEELAAAAGGAGEPAQPSAVSASVEEDEEGEPPGQLLYIRSARLQQLSTGLPVNGERAALVHSLVAAAGLLERPLVDVAEAQSASIEQLREYHSMEYLAALAHFRRLRPAQLTVVGLEDDCAPFPGCVQPLLGMNRGLGDACMSHAWFARLLVHGCCGPLVELAEHYWAQGLRAELTLQLCDLTRPSQHVPTALKTKALPSCRIRSPVPQGLRVCGPGGGRLAAGSRCAGQRTLPYCSQLRWRAAPRPQVTGGWLLLYQ
jgi:hypothetical protein